MGCPVYCSTLCFGRPSSLLSTRRGFDERAVRGQVTDEGIEMYGKFRLEFDIAGTGQDQEQVKYVI